MGLLDQLGSLNPDQQQGLLAAAAQMLQASGPSRTPTSFGQILGGGLGAYQGGVDLARKRQQEEEAAKQSGLLRGLQIQQAQGGLAETQRAQQEAERLRQFYINRQAGQGATPSAASAEAPMASAMPGGQGSPKIGGPDWLQAYQTTQPTTAPAMQPQPQQAASPYQQRMSEAQALRSQGFHAQADAAEAAALKFKPEFATEPRVAVGPDGKPYTYVMDKEGNQKILPGVLPRDKLELASLGGKDVAYNPFALKSGQTFIRTQSPDSIAADIRAAADRTAGGEEAVMDPLAVRMTAQQYLAGDTSALQNFGRGAQGAKNLNAVRLEISKQANAAGLNGADIAAKIAEFGGLKAGQRTAGTRSANIEIAANEAAQLAPLALDASQKVARSGFLPFGKAQVMFDSNTNDPNLRQFAMANNALVNAYGQVMSRGGKATESDKKHASDLLATSFDQPSYAKAVEQLQLEIQAAQKAPKQVRKEMSAATSGRETEQPSAGGKTATLSDIAETARKSGKSTAEVTKAFRDNGYTIGGR